MLLLTFTGCNGTEGSFYPMTNGYAVCRVSNLDVPLIYNKNWKDEVNEVWSGRRGANNARKHTLYRGAVLPALQG